MQQDPVGATDQDTELLALVGTGKSESALALLLERYGDEIYSFLRGTLADEARADDAFALFLEAAWQALPTFQARCSLRTLCYTLARHARARILRDPHARPERHASSAELALLADKVRSRTAQFLRTESKDAIAQLRRELDADEQTLLVLRVDRQLAWSDIARVTLGDVDADAAELTRESAKLRKRFEAVKDKLRTRAKHLGLLED